MLNGALPGVTLVIESNGNQQVPFRSALSTEEHWLEDLKGSW
jgi:hypothetical protein